MSKCIVCGKDARPVFECVKRDMAISLCEDHSDTCDDCEIHSCGRNPASNDQRKANRNK
ncbi:MAG: hypothetical protein JXC85_02175 [Candidatus Aenigmarchaeota archaeon]|nr:hypothetical protein [Candidatus Aenigmarchaeota archaeon]